MLKLHQLGEYGLINRFLKRIDLKKNKHVLIPNGDDACACHIARGKTMVATTDMLIEGVHFLSAWNEWELIGYKSLAVNISDLAAMGDVVPRYALISIGVQPSTPVHIVDKIFTGIHKLAQKYHITVVGGDTVKSPKNIVISICLIGEGFKKNLVIRKNARIGDILLISGYLGLSGAGLRILKNKPKNSLKKYEKTLIYAHLKPPIRLPLGNILGRKHWCNSMIDASDGLHKSLVCIHDASRVGFDIDFDLIPIHPALQEWCKYNTINPMKIILNSGEDYELIFSTSQAKANKILKQINRVFPVGKVVSYSKGINYYYQGKRFKYIPDVFEHFIAK